VIQAAVDQRRSGRSLTSLSDHRAAFRPLGRPHDRRPFDKHFCKEPVMGMLKEFREFAVKGNAIDMAVGIVIGAAFGKIVSSLVNDLLMPPLGVLLGKVDFSYLSIPLQAQTETSPAVELKYGMFINTVIDFLIVAFAIFLLVKQMNRLKRAEAPAEPTTRECPRCISKISLKASRCPHCTSELSPA